ncbi:hypothetical protein GS942_21530 [Rhodococcus hoagii]|nr:hypothetical protein [Prescottella equi]
MTARRRFGAVPVLVAAALLGSHPQPGRAASRTRLPCNRRRARSSPGREHHRPLGPSVRVLARDASEQEVQVLLPRDTSVPRPSLYLLDGRSASPGPEHVDHAG